MALGVLIALGIAAILGPWDASVDGLAFAVQEEGGGQLDARVRVERAVDGDTLEISLAGEVDGSGAQGDT